MALTMKELEEKWPEGPAFAYRAVIERLESYEPGTVCAAKQADSPQCWDLRLAVVGLMRLSAHELQAVRLARNLNPRSWLMTSMAVNMFARIVLDGVR